MIQYDAQTIGYINLFERNTNAKVKDCFNEEEFLVFVVQPENLRKALENHGQKIQRLNLLLKKRIKIIEFNEDPKRFLFNLIYPLKTEIEMVGNTIIIKTKDNKEKGQIFGREKTNLKRIQGILNKYFKLEIKVV
ncbi:NusA-like transcription termination signal-binding factor [Candidatus Woesearchaeota archaeon]|nr:NusA-like transcription termination signal-binding factor [Candidatus Woesearchaeota archaeon]